MLDREQIDNWQNELADAEVFDRVNERADRGVTQHREMRAEEVVPYMRHARRLQAWVAALLDERDQRNAISMSLGEPRKPKEAHADPMR